MSDPGEERALRLLRELKRARGAELRRLHGAHALGIGRRARGGDEQGAPVLRFYVEPGFETRPGVEPVPPHIEFLPAGETAPVRVPTEVVVSRRAAPEGGGTGGPRPPGN